MDLTTLQFQADTNTLIVEGVSFPLELIPLALPGGLYRYGQMERQVDGGPETLSPEQLTTINDAWPFLLTLAVEAYAGQWIQSITGGAEQQQEDILYQLAQLRAGLQLSQEEIDSSAKLVAWIVEVREIRAEKIASLGQPDALTDFDLFSGWPTYPPAGY